jgi:hypothetical protein
MKPGRNSTASGRAVRLITATLFTVTGAVLRDSHLAVGHWITTAALAYYLITCARPSLKGIRYFRSFDSRAKARVGIAGVMFILFVRSFFVTDFSYFAVLVLLAVEYLLLAPHERLKRF